MLMMSVGIRRDGQTYFAGCFCDIQMPLRGRGGWKVWCCPNFPPNRIYELVTDHEEQLASEVHHRGMHWHGIRIRVVAFGPEKIREKLGDEEGRSNLLALAKCIGRERNSVSLVMDSGEKSLTVTQKNRTKNPINKNGTSSHPTPLSTAKNPISIGSVTRKSVAMTSLRLGFLLPSSHLLEEAKAEGRADMTE